MAFSAVKVIHFWQEHLEPAHDWVTDDEVMKGQAKVMMGQWPFEPLSFVLGVLTRGWKFVKEFEQKKNINLNTFQQGLSYE